MGTLLALEGVRRTYDEPQQVGLRNASLHLHAGERVAVVGPSGSGKSTLLNIVGLLDRPQEGTVLLHGRDLSSTFVSESERDRARRTELGFIFQSFHVLGTRTARQNLNLRLSAARTPRSEWRDQVSYALDMVGLTNRADSLVEEFSGGEKQRLAVARALIPMPSLVLADEPTGNLDEGNTAHVLNLLAKAADRAVACLVITHEPKVASWADRVLQMQDGVLH